MAFDYPRFAKFAKRIINENGREVTFVKRSRTPADPAKPWQGTQVTDVTLTVTVTFVPSGSIQGAMGIRSMFRDEEVQDKRHAFVAALDMTSPIESFDFVQDDGRAFSIDQVRTLEPGGVRIVHEMLLDSLE